MIELKGVKKDYHLGETIVHAVKGVDFSIKKGEMLSIVGPSGSGKTTLLNMIGCIDRASEGEIIIGGETISGLSDNELTDLRLYKIGFIFQTFNLIPVLNVIENVEFPLMLMKNGDKAELHKHAEKLIEEVGLADYKTHRPAELSGGQRQRVAIARALVTRPSIILADEPTANLDSETGASILDLMKQLNEIEKTTFVFSTHDPDVLRYAKRVVRIKDGLIVNEGEKQ